MAIFKVLLIVFVFSSGSYVYANSISSDINNSKMQVIPTNQKKTKLNLGNILSTLTILTGIFLAYQNHILLKKTKWYDYKNTRLSNAIDDLHLLISKSLLDNDPEYDSRKKIIDFIHIRSKIASLIDDQSINENFKKIKPILSLGKGKITNEQQTILNTELENITSKIILAIKNA